MSSNTLIQYDTTVSACKKIFLGKTKDYGTSWRILRGSSVADQIFIKAERIRTIEERGVQMVDEGIENEYMGIMNYAVIALIQIEKGHDKDLELSAEMLEPLYDKYTAQAKHLMMEKNHDYGEAWRKIETSSITDLILQKILRIRSIYNNNGQTTVSEGIDANYFDIINYAIFAQIKLKEADENNR